MAYIDCITRDFETYEKNGLVLMRVPAIEETGLYRHGFSTRIGGVSDGCYSTLNLSLTRESNRDNVSENYTRLADALGVDKTLMCACNYEHGTNTVILREGVGGAGVMRDNDLPPCDGVIVTDKSCVALTLHADCTPLFFADKKGRAAGVAHAGWKGTLGGIAVNMINGLGVPADDILIGVGPSIRVCCFEVKDDVASLFTEKYGDTVLFSRDGRLYIDLIAVTLMQLEGCGIPPENVTLSPLCTYCEEKLFYSHRRDRGNTGAMASVIAFA